VSWLLAAAGTAGVMAFTATAPAVASTVSAKGTTHTTQHRVNASDTDNGATVTMRRGGTLKLTLHSTYWTVSGSSDASVLHERGTPVTRPAPRSAHCVPGQGCGTVSATFTAMKAGRADVTASRTTCGEAMLCAPAQARYVLHVVVTG
jgi:hypothetical protein